MTAVKICTYSRHCRDHRYTDTTNRSPMVRSPAQNPRSLKLPPPDVSLISHEYCRQNHSIKYYGDKRRRLLDMIQKRFYLICFPKLFVFPTYLYLYQKENWNLSGNFKASKFCTSHLIINASGWDNEAGVATRLRARGSGVRIPIEARFFSSS